MMEPALANREFQLYLQPKVHLPDEKICGAEALVRWKNEAEGMIFPNEFIPLFEKEIRSAGFGCSMDDFGSGYSSLNLIQSIPVDTLKIDRIFFNNKSDAQERTEAVIGSIVQLAKSLSLTTVAEGVEHREQVEMLKNVGCDYIQGYVFAKPMPVADFDKLVFGDQ